MTAQNEYIISWEAPEFKHYPKNSAWYVTLAAIDLLIIAYMLIQRDLFGAVTMFILGVFIVFFSLQRPHNITIGFTKKAIHIGEFHLPYKNIRHFWIVHNERHTTLNLETTAYLNRMIVLELNGQDPDEVHEFLVRILPEHTETTETTAQKVMHRLKF